jgi:hypothetical protein
MPFSRLIDLFEAKAALCSNDRDLGSLLGDATRELGFDYFALLHHASLARPRAGLIRLDTYPAGWEEEMAAQGLIGADPVHHASVRTNIGFAWTELAQLVPIGRRQGEVLARARRFDIGDGFTVPVNVPGEPAGSCSFAVRLGCFAPSSSARMPSARRGGFMAIRRGHAARISAGASASAYSSSPPGRRTGRLPRSSGSASRRLINM